VRIAFVVPAVKPDTFSAGMYTILTYARLLRERGHKVLVVPLGFGRDPSWIEVPKGSIVEHSPTPRSAARAFVQAAAALLRSRLGRTPAEAVPMALSELVRQVAPYCHHDALRRGSEFDRLRRVSPDCDVTIATGAPTVAPVYVYGKGALVHFMQHYEVWFTDAFEDPVFAEAEARLAHALPLRRIANVGWIAELVRDQTGEAVPICWVGIDHSVFHPEGAPPERPFTVLTYGGRGISWKGFDDAAEAIAIARQEIPELRWRVFGGASLPPDNDTAPYEDLGFVTGAVLRRLYSTAHVTLLPSWYEGFPVPPLEAMACGSAVIATPRGAGDVAEDRENALLVPPRSPEAMAEALVSLWREPDLRDKLVTAGVERAKGFTWERSVERFESLLEEAIRSSEQRVTGTGPS
jgi:glycosyltransferase involved in cell wall biosynthesis